MFLDHLCDGLEVITATRATGAENERHALAADARPDLHAAAADELLAIGGHRQQLKHLNCRSPNLPEVMSDWSLT